MPGKSTVENTGTLRDCHTAFRRGKTTIITVVRSQTGWPAVEISSLGSTPFTHTLPRGVESVPRLPPATSSRNPISPMELPPVKVTRIAYSDRINAGKHAELEEQSRRLGRVRSLVWDRFGSLAGVGVSDRTVRDQWLKDGTAALFDVTANAWKETIRDAMGDIKAHRDAAKADVRRKIARRNIPDGERKRLYIALKYDKWMTEPLLRRLMRQSLRRGHSHAHNQIIVRSDIVSTFRREGDDRVWLKVTGLKPRQPVIIPLRTSVAPTGTLRLILRGNRVEVHYTVDGTSLKSAQRPCGTWKLGVDKGYTEVLTDSDGRHHGPEFGALLTAHSDKLKERNARRAKLRSIANSAAARGDHAKAQRIRDNNLGVAKKVRQDRATKTALRDVVYTAVNRVTDDASVIVAEDLTRPIRGRSKGRNTNRRLAMWTKGIIAQALTDISERRGSSLRLVNAAYTSQVIPGTSIIGRRIGDRLHCPHGGGVVWHADHAAAVNILNRDGDTEISLHTPHTRVKQIIRERDDRQRLRLPSQDSNSGGCRCGERIIPVTNQL